MMSLFYIGYARQEIKTAAGKYGIVKSVHSQADMFSI